MAFASSWDFYPTCPTIFPETSAAATPLVGRSSSNSSSQSCDSSGVTKQHATHAWRYTVVGVVVRCIFFVGDSNGRTASIFVTYCGAASLLYHQNCCHGDFRDGVWFSLFDVLQKLIVVARISGAAMFMFIFNSGVRNAYLTLFMYLFFFFFSSYWQKNIYVLL